MSSKARIYIEALRASSMKVLILVAVLLLWASTFSASAEGVYSTYSSEEEFFASQPYMAYVIINEGMECLRKNELFQPGLQDLLRRSSAVGYTFEDCMGGIEAMSKHARELFPPETASLLQGEINSLSTTMRNYILCIEGHFTTCGGMTGGPSVLETFPSHAKVTGIIITAGLIRWYNETWCPIPNRATTSAFCTDIVGHE